MTKPPRFHDCWLDVETFLREFARFAYDHLNMLCADDFDRLADRVIRKVADLVQANRDLQAAYDELQDELDRIRRM